MENTHSDVSISHYCPLASLQILELVHCTFLFCTASRFDVQTTILLAHVAIPAYETKLKIPEMR
jgi:hypothetical protein